MVGRCTNARMTDDFADNHLPSRVVTTQQDGDVLPLELDVFDAVEVGDRRPSVALQLLLAERREIFGTLDLRHLASP